MTTDWRRMLAVYVEPLAAELAREFLPACRRLHVANAADLFEPGTTLLGIASPNGVDGFPGCRAGMLDLGISLNPAAAELEAYCVFGPYSSEAERDDYAYRRLVGVAIHEIAHLVTRFRSSAEMIAVRQRAMRARRRQPEEYRAFHQAALSNQPALAEAEAAERYNAIDWAHHDASFYWACTVMVRFLVGEYRDSIDLAMVLPSFGTFSAAAYESVGSTYLNQVRAGRSALDDVPPMISALWAEDQRLSLMRAG